MKWHIGNLFKRNAPKKIHWFSGINKAEYRVYKEYIKMYTKAVISQIKTNPNIQAYLIFDGEKDEFIDYLEKTLNVIVITYKVSFYDKLKEFYVGNSIAAGAYLRCDIPIIVRDILQLDVKYVLYTDNDILFMNDVSKLNNLKPKYFNISSEFSKDKYTDINSGVMWINIDSMYNIHSKFSDFITNNFDKFRTYDQDAIKLFFDGKMNILDYRYNYKPYFGKVKPDNIKILHFHGPKPQHLQMCIDKTYPIMEHVNGFYFDMVEYYNNLTYDD